MNKKTYLSALCVLVLLIALSAVMTGCSCKHEWKDATCDTPKTCTKCNEAEGEALSHKWADATCETAKTCSLCQKTEGNALGHKWADATCETAKTCSVCNKTEGSALGHKWADATCETAKTCSNCKKTEGEALGHKWIDATTEAPKTCSVCSKTEGDRIITDPRFKTEACKALIGTWQGILRMKGSETGIEGFTGVLELAYTLNFGNDGSYKETLSIANKDAFTKALEDDYVAAFYAEFAKQGLNQAQADAAMKATYGMDVRGYSKYMVSAANWDTIYNTTVIGVYYVANGLIYSGESWTAVLDSDTYAISGNTLTIASLSTLFPDLKFTKLA